MADWGELVVEAAELGPDPKGVRTELLPEELLP